MHISNFSRGQFDINSTRSGPEISKHRTSQDAQVTQKLAPPKEEIVQKEIGAKPTQLKEVAVPLSQTDATDAKKKSKSKKTTSFMKEFKISLTAIGRMHIAGVGLLAGSIKALKNTDWDHPFVNGDPISDIAAIIGAPLYIPSHAATMLAFTPLHLMLAAADAFTRSAFDTTLDGRPTDEVNKIVANLANAVSEEKTDADLNKARQDSQTRILP